MELQKKKRGRPAIYATKEEKVARRKERQAEYRRQTGRPVRQDLKRLTDEQRRLNKLAINKRYSDRHPENVLKTRLRKYNITLHDYHTLLAKQGGRCAACGFPGEACQHGRLVVDHCHTLGIVRGLLCNNCNAVIGFARESRQRLEGCIDYLTRLGYGE